MPQAIPAVLAAVAYVGTATSAVLAGTATIAQIATVAAVGIGAGVGSAALSKAMAPQIGSQGAAVQWIADPDEALRFAFGRVGVKGSIKDAAVYGPDRMYVSFACTVSAAGPIKRFVSFRAGDYIMSFDGNGKAINEPYRDEMWLSMRLGAQPDTALSLPSGLKNGASFPGWNSNRRLSGSAAYLVTLGENSKRSAYEGKIPAFVATIEGLYCYDPRLDSTYPGGSGSCRLNDPATWVWTQNPILFALKWALGLWEGPTGKGAPQVDYQVGGIGAKVEGIRLSTAVEAANIADANGWTSAAWPSTDDDKAAVLDNFLKAGGARYAEIAGQMAFIHRAAPRAPVFTVTARDTAGPVEIDTTSSKLNRINTARPRYWSEAHEWEMTALPEVTSTVWQEEDGRGVAVKRTRGIDFSFVPQAKQARELASLEISHSREAIRGRVPLRPYMDPEPGNCFLFDEPDFALSNVECFVLDVEDDTENDTVIVTFETETDGKYPFAYGQVGNPPPPQTLDPRDPREVNPPLPGDWTITVRPPTADGGQVPGFDLTGLVSNDTATAIIVEWGLTNDATDAGNWTQAYQGPPNVTTVPINGLQPGQSYYIAVRYQRNQNYSDRYVYGPFVAPPLVADDVSPAGTTITGLQDQITEVFGDVFDVSADLAAAETLINEQGVEIAAARGGAPNLNSRIVTVDQARIDGDEASAEAISLVEARTDQVEADIFDVETALANQTEAQALAIEQVSVRLDDRPNMVPNSDFAVDTAGWMTGTWFRSSGPDDGTFLINGTAGDQFFSSQPIPASAGQIYTVAFSQVASGQVATYIEPVDAGGALVGPALAFGAYTGLGRKVMPSFTLPAGATAYKIVGYKPAGVPFTAVTRFMANTGTVAIPWRNDAAQRELAASVTEQSLSLIGLEDQNALAAYEVEALASGGLPAFLRLVSSTLGGYAALAAPVVALLNTVPGVDDPLVAMEARGGEVFFPRPIYIDLNSRRLIVGPGNGWVLWFGPDTINAASATRTNGYFALGDDGKVYLGTLEISDQARAKRTAGFISTSGSLALDFNGVTAGGSWQFQPAARDNLSLQVAAGATGKWTIYEQTQSDTGTAGTAIASGTYSTEGFEPTRFIFIGDLTATAEATGNRRVRLILSEASDGGNINASFFATYFPPSA